MAAVMDSLYFRSARRVNSYAAAKSKDRGISSLTFIDFEKVPKRFVIYGQLLFVSLVLKEWDPSIETFSMGEGDRDVTPDNPAYDASSPVICTYRDGAHVWETCLAEAPTTAEGRAAIKCRELDAAKVNATHRIFTRRDGLGAAIRFENCLFLNSIMQRVPPERFTCQMERRFLEDILTNQRQTNLDSLLSIPGVDKGKMLATAARFIHTGRVKVDLDHEELNLLTPLTLVC
ncbi:hypothetical protein AYM40_10585 [Paraburkholderia phytofirmans OLGA172]|uniref:TnsA endonuclease N-terminal domain-containing protein n=1 Tax=Paraburkholderia phytofirmans OLGA172 TaxID=1417228 RepID=A0A160FK35_9BURK|nr:hypothetical protein [Paraburkholderia phytofirmans]ANB72759.1 hypothetical protein AYM40_10585 [Paraburkholderia phytofirmans OLGA172]